MHGADSDYKGVSTEYTDLDLPRNIKLFKVLYQGGYNLDVYIMPKVSTIIHIAKNTLYPSDIEKNLLKCVDNLLENQKQENKPKGVAFIEDVINVG
jgi:hypothetical protein